jgi:hypothetical protein
MLFARCGKKKLARIKWICSKSHKMNLRMETAVGNLHSYREHFICSDHNTGKRAHRNALSIGCACRYCGMHHRMLNNLCSVLHKRNILLVGPLCSVLLV